MQGGRSIPRVARHVARQQVQDESDRHVVILDEKDDQKIFEDDSSLQRVRRLILGRDEDQARLRVGTHARSIIRERLDGKTEMTILRIRLKTAREGKILF